ncbi:MAG: hypothetical protein ACYC69_17260 [Thermodesulfovibrionales bacterium]
MNKFVISSIVVLLVSSLAFHASAAGKCPEATKVNITSKNGAYPPGLNWSKIQASVATLDKSIGKTAAYIYIANFPIGGDPLHARPAEGQGILYFGISIADQKQKNIQLRTGKYDLADYSGTAPMRGQADIKVRGGSAVQLNTDNKGTFEITSATGKEICGTFQLKDKWTSLSGEFRAVVK